MLVNISGILFYMYDRGESLKVAFFIWLNLLPLQVVTSVSHKSMCMDSSAPMFSVLKTTFLSRMVAAGFLWAVIVSAQAHILIHDGHTRPGQVAADPDMVGVLEGGRYLFNTCSLSVLWGTRKQGSYWIQTLGFPRLSPGISCGHSLLHPLARVQALGTTTPGYWLWLCQLIPVKS